MFIISQIVDCINLEKSLQVMINLGWDDSLWESVVIRLVTRLTPSLSAVHRSKHFLKNCN